MILNVIEQQKAIHITIRFTDEFFILKLAAVCTSAFTFGPAMPFYST